MRNFRCLFLLIVAFVAPYFATPIQASTLAERLQGYVLLQTELHGEAWYVYPVDQSRYYMRDGAAAYQIMRQFGLGITNANLTRLQTWDRALRTRFKGRILLQVEAHGEAYYICPKDLSVRYLRDGAAAYQVMRTCSLGISNANLEQIPAGFSSYLPPLYFPPSPTFTPIPTPVPPPISTPLTPTSASSVPTIAGCQIFPADNPWNQDVSHLPVHPNSAAYIRSIGANEYLHADFGENPDYGIPFNVVPSTQTKVPITWTAYGDESDAGPYPIPPNAKQEPAGDAHVLVLDSGACKLYELYHARKTDNGWSADSGAIFDLRSNALRPDTWTSADAAGLPILPGLVRYEEVAAGAVNHAIRFTADDAQDGWIYPATHPVGSDNPSLPPMGLRVRMKADYNISHLTGQARVIAMAMKKYGMILADNGSPWFFTGATDSRWNDEELNQLKDIPGSAFEAVYTGEIHKR